MSIKKNSSHILKTKEGYLSGEYEPIIADMQAVGTDVNGNIIAATFPLGSQVVGTDADGNIIELDLDNDIPMLGTDQSGHIVNKSSEYGKVRINNDDANAGFLENKLADTVDVEWTPTADNSQIESIVYQLTGKGASLASKVVVGSEGDPLVHTIGPGISGFKYGRGCSPGYAYKLDPLTNVMKRTRVWIAQSSNGDLYQSFNYFETAQKDTSCKDYDSANGGRIPASYGASCISYIRTVNGLYQWVAFVNDAYGFFRVMDIPENYNDDGSFKLSAWEFVTVDSVWFSKFIGHTVQVTSGGVFATASFAFRVVYSPDLINWSLAVAVPDPGPSGISGDSYGTYMTVARNTGILYRNNSEANGGTFSPTAWAAITSADGFEVNDVAANNLPVSGSGTDSQATWWSGMGSAYGLWVCTVAKKWDTTVDPVYAYSDDGIKWYTWGTSVDELINIWDIVSDGAFFFGCPPDDSPNLVYQVLVNSIPAHKRLVAEKGLMIVGDAFVADTPNANILGTDVNGKIVAKSITIPTLEPATTTSLGSVMVGDGLTITPGGVLSVKNRPFCSTVPLASVNSIGMVYRDGIGEANEICVGFIPDRDIILNKDTYFIVAFANALTGDLIVTIRDADGKLIRKSIAFSLSDYPVTTPRFVNLHIDGDDHDTLLEGYVYYLGLLHNLEGVTMYGVSSHNTMNLRPISAWKFNNMSTPEDLLVGGVETLFKPLIMISNHAIEETPPYIGKVGYMTLDSVGYSTIIMPDGNEWLRSDVSIEGSDTLTDLDVSSLVLPYGWRIPTLDDWLNLDYYTGLTDTNVESGNILTEASNNFKLLDLSNSYLIRKDSSTVDNRSVSIYTSPLIYNRLMYNIYINNQVGSKLRLVKNTSLSKQLPKITNDSPKATIGFEVVMGNSYETVVAPDDNVWTRTEILIDSGPGLLIDTALTASHWELSNKTLYHRGKDIVEIMEKVSSISSILPTWRIPTNDDFLSLKTSSIINGKYTTLAVGGSSKLDFKNTGSYSDSQGQVFLGACRLCTSNSLVTSLYVVSTNMDSQFIDASDFGTTVRTPFRMMRAK